MAETGEHHPGFITSLQEHAARDMGKQPLYQLIPLPFASPHHLKGQLQPDPRLTHITNLPQRPLSVLFVCP